MFGKAFVLILVSARISGALSINLMTKTLIEKVVGRDAVMSSGILELRKGVAGQTGVLTNTGMEHNPKLKPLYIALITITCIVAVITIVVSLVKCTDCFACCGKRRATRQQSSMQDPEQGASELATIEPCVSVPRTAKIRVTKPVAASN
ncbi:hypothetical protein F5X99DRAFT_428104 [Biscogniauxia marginata]|nr:hypothetical protein F5X99DRAFT_428104 [Biscogniauxia marginata]